MMHFDKEKLKTTFYSHIIGAATFIDNPMKSNRISKKTIWRSLFENVHFRIQVIGPREDVIESY